MPLSSGVRRTGSSVAKHTSGDTYLKIGGDQTDNEVVIIGLSTVLLLFVVAAVFVALMMVAFFVLIR